MRPATSNTTPRELASLASPRGPAPSAPAEVARETHDDPRLIRISRHGGSIERFSESESLDWEAIVETVDDEEETSEARKPSRPSVAFVPVSRLHRVTSVSACRRYLRVLRHLPARTQGQCYTALPKSAHEAA